MFCCLFQTPVHLAAEKGHLHCLNLLLDFGGDCSYLDNEGNSPIDYAHRNQNLLCEHLLLKHLGMMIEHVHILYALIYYVYITTKTPLV